MARETTAYEIQRFELDDHLSYFLQVGSKYDNCVLEAQALHCPKNVITIDSFPFFPLTFVACPAKASLMPEIEIFGHGALCMAVSGKCYLSLHSHNSSANRGACKQNCRKKYTVIDQESGFEMELDNVDLIPVIIGKGGATVRKLQTDKGVTIRVSKPKNTGEKLERVKQKKEH